MELNKDFWNNRYANQDTGWDVGYPSTPLKEYVDQLEDKQVRILIPGCGNAYEAEYLHAQGFTNVFVIDIAPLALEQFAERVPSFPKNQLICGNFFEHQAKYDLILEQTFFCAIDPALRQDYAKKVNELLVEGGTLAGLLFAQEMYVDHPPYGGRKEEYEETFSPYFNFKHLAPAYNSIEPRAGKELFICFKK
jgi:SAM-dependent methyltransferase